MMPWKPEDLLGCILFSVDYPFSPIPVATSFLDQLPVSRCAPNLGLVLVNSGNREPARPSALPSKADMGRAGRHLSEGPEVVIRLHRPRSAAGLFGQARFPKTLNKQL